MTQIEFYQNGPAECLEYDPQAPAVARLVSELILSASAVLSNQAPKSGPTELAPDGSLQPDNPASDMIASNVVDLIVEHIGSTSVPDCAGKGIIDLMLLYSEGGLEHAKQVLDSLGFQRQGTRDPFPESRPMRLGAVRYQGRQYRLHVHVISATSPEAALLRGFRDTLIADQNLRKSYEERKREIIEAGTIDSVDYSDAKHGFISGAINDCRLASATEGFDQ
jgi:GrpB-like predicted nucleotidyltransferase (UPF0157 family)